MNQSFLEFKRQYLDFESFLVWAMNHEYESEMKQGSSGMHYQDMRIGDRLIQTRTFNLRRYPAKSPAIAFSPEITEFHYCWESVYGTKSQISKLSKKYNASFMEAPYTELENDWILIFKEFKDALRFLWDTAESWSNFKSKFEANPNDKSLPEYYKESYLNFV